MDLQSLIKSTVEAVVEKSATAAPTTHNGTVETVDGNTANVLFDGGESPTPCTMRVSCVAGQRVSCVIENHRAYVTGNVSAPPTDDTEASIAKTMAELATESARRARASAIEASTAASEAQESAASASAAAAAAQDTADDAASAASAAQSSADAAATAAGNAQSTADSAASAASAAQSSADAAATAAGNAQSTADSAASAASAAQSSANAAATAASAAQATANSAASAASAAQASANAAQTSANNAQDSADAASDALQSVVSGATTVEKAVSVMQTALEAVVDYDADDDTTTEYFWHDANGAHVLGDTSGYRNDTSSTGMTIVDTSDEESVASFGADGAQIGKASAGNYIALDSDSFDLYHNSTEMVHFGYGEGTAPHEEDESALTTQSDEETGQSNGVATAPYYTLGTRPTNDYGEYSSANTYSVGDQATHDGVCYVCIKDVDSPMTWDSSYWQHSIGNYSVSEGDHSTASGYASHAEGYTTTAVGNGGHAEGFDSFAIGFASHAEGSGCKAVGYSSHAEGSGTVASFDSHAEGYCSEASGVRTHAEGKETTASGEATHAEGHGCVASGYRTHAEGCFCEAEGDASHAEGMYCVADGFETHAQNLGTIARSEAQTALGKYNVEDTNDTYAIIVGNGTSDNARSNALTVDWDGDVETAGDVTIRTSNIDRDGTAPSTSQFSNGRFRIADVDNEAIAYSDGYQLTTGETGVRLIALAEDANGDAIINTFRVGKMPDGTNVYYVSDPSAFREAVNAVGTSDQSSQNATLGSINGTTQHWVLRSNVINSNNTTYYGHNTGLIMDNVRPFLYDFTGQGTIWSAYTTRNPQPADAWDVYKSTTVSQVITAASGRTVSSVTYAEWGKVAQLSVACTGFSASTGAQTVGTVVSGKRPVYNVYATDVTSSYAVYAQLTTAGALTVYWGTAPSTSTTYTIRFIYILA